MSFEPQFRIRRSWFRRFFIAVIVIALLAGIGVWISSFFKDSESKEPAAGPPAATEPSGNAGRVANGCLGGQALTAQTVLTAQRDAGLDDIGAAEFAATLARWGGGSGGVPPAEEISIVMDAIEAEDASEKVAGQEERLLAAAEEERQGVETSTIEGGFYIESSSEDEVVVSVLTVDEDIDPEENRVLAGSTTWTMDRSTGEWMLVDFGGTREVKDLSSIMTPFVGGC